MPGRDWPTSHATKLPRRCFSGPVDLEEVPSSWPRGSHTRGKRHPPPQFFDRVQSSSVARLVPCAVSREMRTLVGLGLTKCHAMSVFGSIPASRRHAVQGAWRQVELSTGSRAPAETPRPVVSPCWGGLTVPRPQRGAIFCKGFLPVVQLIEFRGEP